MTDDYEVEVTLRFRCMASDLQGTEVGHLYADLGRSEGITTAGIGHVVVNHRAEHGYVWWTVAPYSLARPDRRRSEPA